MKFVVLLTLILLPFSLCAQNQRSQIPIFSTGVDDGGTPLPLGSVDPHFVVVETGNQAVVLNPAHQAWLPNDATSQWIWLTSDSAKNINKTWTFRTTFDLTGFDPSTAQIDGLVAVDNGLSGIKLNGIKIPSPGADFTSFTRFSITSGFQPGINTLEFIARDWGVVAGFNVQLSGTGEKNLGSDLDDSISPRQIRFLRTDGNNLVPAHSVTFDESFFIELGYDASPNFDSTKVSLSTADGKVTEIPLKRVASESSRFRSDKLDASAFRNEKANEKLKVSVENLSDVLIVSQLITRISGADRISWGSKNKYRLVYQQGATTKNWFPILKWKIRDTHKGKIKIKRKNKIDPQIETQVRTIQRCRISRCKLARRLKLFTFPTYSASPNLHSP